MTGAVVQGIRMPRSWKGNLDLETFYRQLISLPAISSQDFPVGVTGGGTGSTTASGARSNLGVSATGEDDNYLAKNQNLGDLENVAQALGNLMIQRGFYTPTLTNVTNLGASTAYECQYMRVFDIVHVSGKVSVDPTAGAATELGISLPIASTFTAEQHLAGTAAASGIAGQVAAILADTTNFRAKMVWVAVDTTNQPMFFTFTYRIVSA